MLKFLVRRLLENRVTTIVVILLFFLAATIVWNLFGPHPDARLEAIRRNGYPVTLSELNAWYQAVPDSQNNARIYEQVFALPGFGNFVEPRWPPRGQVLSVADKKQLAELVATNQAALLLLHSVQASSRCRYSINLNKIFCAGQPGYEFKIIDGVNLLTAEGLWHAANGHSQQAVSSFLAGGMLADSLSDEPLFISQILRPYYWTIILLRLEHALALMPMTEEQLNSLQAMIARAERPEVLRRALAGERAYGLAVFAEPVKLLESSPYSSTECLKDDLVIGFSKSTGLFEKDRMFYLDALEKSVAAASLPFPERLNLGLLIPNPRASSRFFSVSRHVLPKISDAFVSEANMAALLRSAQTALAVERFRCRHGGRLPGKLEELVPAYCEAVPLDPFDGTPLRFELLNSGYAVDSSAFDTRNGGHLGFRVIRRGDHSSHAVSGP